MSSPPHPRVRHRPSPPPLAAEPTHSHRLPRTVVWALAAIVTGMAAALVLTLVYAAGVNARLDDVEGFITARTEQRDAERDELRAELAAAVCAVLDELPADTSALTHVRTVYGCGPGRTD